MDNSFELDARLKNDCVVLGKLKASYLLLMNQSEVPWFILVPVTQEIELCDLDDEMHLIVQNEIKLLCQFVRENFEIDKLNVAAIGNVVKQLHIHVLGRRENDSCWPAPVWGKISSPPYEQEAIDRIKEKVSSSERLALN